MTRLCGPGLCHCDEADTCPACTEGKVEPGCDGLCEPCSLKQAGLIRRFCTRCGTTVRDEPDEKPQVCCGEEMADWPEPVHVPDVPAPTGICWRQGPLMHLCRLAAGHDGPHEWDRCEWTEDEDGNWDTACDNKDRFIEGGPYENGMKFCCYCGKRGAWARREP